MQAKLKIATKESRNIRRHIAEVRMEGLVEELWEHWRGTRLAECHRVLRSISLRKSGPKQRRFASLRTALPTKQQWMEIWQEEGFDGGDEGN